MATPGRRRALAAGGLVLGMLVTGLIGGPASAVDPADPSELEQRVTVAAVRTHLTALQAVADAHGGDRAAGTSGYEASAEYVEAVLRAAGYAPTRQYFDAVAQTIDDYALEIDGLAFTDDEDGDGTPDPLGIPADLTPSTPDLTGTPLVAPAVATGCDAEAWAGVVAAGAIAVISRGDCTFAEKSAAAGAAGAVAAIVYNDVEGPLESSLVAQTSDQVATVGILRSQGEAILAAMAAGTVTAGLRLQQTTTVTPTFSVIAETAGGTADNVVMLGAHLDSVPGGPGVNDNGSGVGAILETAVQLAASGTTNNRVRFAWWGAEEIGMLGSAAYLDALSDEDLDRIAVYLNFDMLASPNHVVAIYDADESTYPAAVEVPEGSAAVEAAFADWFDAAGQPHVDTALDGYSDYEPFMSNGVPSGGVFSGAGAIKTAAEAALFGGTAGLAMDPAYHTAGDDLSNVDDAALAALLPAIAHVTAALAADTSAVNGFASPAVASAAPPAPGAASPRALAESGAPDMGAWSAAAALLVAAGALALRASRGRAGARR
jgi:Zn-dependent M28 family amino/carboxypeptidase